MALSRHKYVDSIEAYFDILSQRGGGRFSWIGAQGCPEGVIGVEELGVIGEDRAWLEGCGWGFGIWLGLWCVGVCEFTEYSDGSSERFREADG